MQEPADTELLRQYAEQGAEEAFAALVARYVNLVYSAALRKTANGHAAEEITQAVFLILARKARNLCKETVLSGWLYQTARLTAGNFLRGEIRRSRREQEAFMQSLADEPEPESWPRIAPLLEVAMGRLNERDRDAIVLRFFEGKSFQEIGTTLGATENAVKKRVAHALEKLRRYFSRRGVTLTTALIAVALTANAVQAAPVNLAATIAVTAKGSVLATSLTTLVEGTLNLMTWMKLKFALGTGATILFAAGVATLVYSGRAPLTPAGALKQKMALAYQQVKTYSATISFAVKDKETGNALGEAMRYEIAFDRAKNSFRFELRDRQPSPREIVGVCNGRTLWFRDTTPIVDRSGQNVRPAGLVLEMPVNRPLKYQQVFGTVHKLKDDFFPIFGLLLGEDLIRELQSPFPVQPASLTLLAVPPRADDPLKRPGLKVEGWAFPPGGKSIEAMTYWLDPETSLVTLITVEMQSAEKSDDPIRPVEGQITVVRPKLNEPVEPSLSRFDTTGLKFVHTYAELTGRPSSQGAAKR